MRTFSGYYDSHRNEHNLNLNWNGNKSRGAPWLSNLFFYLVANRNNERRTRERHLYDKLSNNGLARSHFRKLDSAKAKWQWCDELILPEKLILRHGYKAEGKH